MQLSSPCPKVTSPWESEDLAEVPEFRGWNNFFRRTHLRDTRGSRQGSPEGTGHILAILGTKTSAHRGYFVRGCQEIVLTTKESAIAVSEAEKPNTKRPTRRYVAGEDTSQRAQPAEMSVNIKNPAIKRIHADVRELMKDPSDQYHAAPLESNLFEWHFTIRGPPDTEFEGGVYHGRIILPPEYPFRPPDIMFNTPNGRFSTGMKVCLTISSYHPEHWQVRALIVCLFERLIGLVEHD